MKKLLLSASLLINLVLLLFACTKEKVNEGSRAELVPKQASTPGRYTNRENSAGACTDPFQGMPYALVREMINNYRTHQQPAIEASLGISDANMCWFDLARMKDFICHLESLVAASGCNNISGLGLRFYYGAHGDNPVAYGLPGNYTRLHNLVIVPTYTSESGENTDFDPTKIDPNTCVPIPLRQLRNGERMGNIIVANSSISATDSIFAMNHGQLGPPGSIAGAGF